MVRVRIPVLSLSQSPCSKVKAYDVKRLFLPAALLILIFAFWQSSDVQTIAAGVAIFLFGMMMLEDGFKALGGGMLERMLAGATRSTPRALLFGIVSTTMLQSSSLVSVLTISFLSAGLISLIGGVGIILGANIGTTTGAWLVAGLGLKVNISAYAMPMLAFSIVLVFQKNKLLRGAGYVLAGMGFLFLGIHYMKEGFDAVSAQIDLSKFALAGVLGLAVYTLVGTAATVVMQSSHATMVLILTALSAGQITYENALALAIGSNIGTTVTAVLGALGANYQGQRLALAHLIFNVTTAVVALALIVPLREVVDAIAGLVGIAEDDYALKLAVFHTIFNVMGVAMMLPMLNRLVRFLEHRISDKMPGVSQPHFLNASVAEFPQTLEPALRNEVIHLYDNAVALILKGLNLPRDEVFSNKDLEAVVRDNRTQVDLDLALDYERRIKTLHSAIVDYVSRAGDDKTSSAMTDRIQMLREVANSIVAAVKSVKHLHKNIDRYTTHPQGTVTTIYDELRAEIARILVEIDALAKSEPGDRSSLWLDQERAEIEEDARSRTRRIDALIRSRQLAPLAATSFLNDSTYAYDAMRELIAVAQGLYAEQDAALAEVEGLLVLEDDELDESDTDETLSQDDSGEANKTVTEPG